MYSCTAPRPARDGIPHPSCVPLTGISDSVSSLPWLWSDEDFQKSAKRPMFVLTFSNYLLAKIRSFAAFWGPPLINRVVIY